MINLKIIMSGSKFLIIVSIANAKRQHELSIKCHIIIRTYSVGYRPEAMGL